MRLTAAEHKTPCHEPGQGILKGAKVPPHQQVDRSPGWPGRAHPAPEHRRPAHGGLVEQLEQNRKLGPMVELTREQREWIHVEQPADLILAQSKQLHQRGRALALQVTHELLF